MSNIPVPLINGAYYSYSDIEINVGPGIIVGVKSVNYGNKLGRAWVRGTNREPIGMTSGQYETTGDFELYLPQAKALLNLLGPGYLQKTIPSVNISYGGDLETAPLGITTDEMQAVRIIEVGAAQSEGIDALSRKFTIMFQRLLLDGLVAVNVPLPGNPFIIG